MEPLRHHIGILDEQTQHKIYAAQHELQKLRDLDDDQFTERKNDVFNATELARQFVKADKIAFRLGLIQRALATRENGK